MPFLGDQQDNPNKTPVSAAVSSPTDLDLLNAGTSGKKSSFDRIVEKLASSYPHYSRSVGIK